MTPSPSRGFTLLETVVVVALAAAMLVALALLIYTFTTTSNYEQAAATTSGSASEVMGEIETLVLPAEAVIASHAFSGTTFTSTTTSVVVEIPSIDSSGNAVSNTWDYAVIYATSTNKVYATVAADPSSKRASGTKLLSSSVTALSFTYDNTDFTQVGSVTADLTSQTQVKNQTTSDHRRETLWLRNF